MDYSGQYQQFPGDQAYNGFMPVAPLTPAHSHSATSDDFNMSPPETFETLNAGTQFQNFDYSQGFNAPQQQQSLFGGPPTPPSNGLFSAQQQQQAFRSQPQQSLSPFSSGASNGPNEVMNKADRFGDDGSHRPGSDDDEMNGDNATPAQSKRKAQNRAAQRAFRERKEKHVKDLESKLANLESAQQQAAVENERLKADLQKISTENEILRATGGGGNANHPASPEPISTGPMTYQPKDFYTTLLKGHNNQTLSHRIAFADDGERLLGSAATWDFIISHPLYKAGMVNIADVSENLNHRAKCDGQGPVFSESTIIDAIQRSVASGSDDLL